MFFTISSYMVYDKHNTDLLETQFTDSVRISRTFYFDFRYFENTLLLCYIVNIIIINKKLKI